jgi:KDO2-lipid IV(A) lauroyltransferase
VRSGELATARTHIAGTKSRPTARTIGPRFAKKRHERALANLRIASPEKTEAERLAICMAHWENLGNLTRATVIYAF